MSKIIKSLIVIALFMGSAVTTFGQDAAGIDFKSWVTVHFDYPQYPAPDFTADVEVTFSGTSSDKDGRENVNPDGGCCDAGSYMTKAQISRMDFKVTINRNGEVYTRYYYHTYGHKDNVTLSWSGIDGWDQAITVPIGGVTTPE